MGAEDNLTELDTLPEFLQAISGTPMLQGNCPEFPSMVCIGHPFAVRFACPIRPNVSIFDHADLGNLPSPTLRFQKPLES
jgi:hypothetical protein